MKKIVLAAVVFFSVFAGNTKASETQTLATWLWNPWEIVNDESGTITFLDGKNVNKVYLQIDRDIPQTVYQGFIEKASAKGIKIYALDGGPDWVATKGDRNLDQLMNWLKTYQNGSSSLQKFAGVHLDVEPYLYSGWSTNQAAAIKSYQSLLLKAKSSTIALTLPLEADLPFWFDEVSYKNTFGKGILAEWVIANTSSITIMAYRDSAPMIIDLVKNELSLTGKYNKQIVLGVETGQTDEGGGISFFEEGEVFMNQELAEVKSFYSQTPAFGGTAIHHAGSWEIMKP
ncbi:amidase [Neobacillus vireti]|uniref:amidase n=1 Tax=Neobacillus vireti TaxID=220686 RepID=UPI003000E38D